MGEKTSKRGWVKDAAIIFLAVLLVLTFFSSTILNRSLPQVVTEYVAEGTITSKVRGTGTVTAKENYDVILQQTRKVQSVLVRVGDQVSVGDVLFVLSAGDSSELDAARDQLNSLELQLLRMEASSSGWDGTGDSRDVVKARELLAQLRAKAAECALTDAERTAYRTAYKAAAAEAESLLAQIAELQPRIDACTEELDAASAVLMQKIMGLKEVEDTQKAEATAKQQAYDALHVTTAAAQEKKAGWDAALAEAIQKRDSYGSGSASYGPMESAGAALEAAKAALEQAKRELETQNVIHGDAYAELVAEAEAMMEVRFRSDIGLAAGVELTAEQAAGLLAFQQDKLEVYLPAAAQQTGVPARADAYDAISAAQRAVDSAQQSCDSASTAYDIAYYEYVQENQDNYQYYQAQREVTAAQKEVDAAAEELKKAEKAEAPALKEWNTAKAALEETQQAISAVQAEITSIENRDVLALPFQQAKVAEELNGLMAEKEKLQAKADSASAEAEKQKNELEQREAQYRAASDAVDSQQDTLDNLIVDQKVNSIERDNLIASIEKQKALIEELSGEDGGTEVKSRVAGTVQSLSVSAGRDAVAGNVLATIEVPDLGYSLRFTVTNEQARRLKVGDSTTISNYYWGSQINATLVSIQTDSQNPQSSKLLTFDLTGDVTAGSSLTLSIGDRNANYDMVVPNSAIRSDVNGSFVLKVTAKNSPLGNRYFATRVSVEVIASDEKYSAISGAIDPYDSVITTASGNAPISAGDQVRLADTNA